MARDDPRQRDAQRSEVLARKRRRQLGVVDTRREAALRLEEVEVDRVGAGLGRLDDVVQLQRAEWDGVGRVLGGRDRGFRRGLGDEHRGHADDRRHDRELRPSGAQEAPLLDDRGDLPLETRHREPVVVEAQ